MARDKLGTPSKAAESIKRTPWKVDVRDRLSRVQEDVEMAVRVNGWEITGAPDWEALFSGPDDKNSSGRPEAPNRPGADNGLSDNGSGQIALKAVDGAASGTQMREAEAVVASTFVYISETAETLCQSTRLQQRPLEWLTGALLLSAYTSLHAAEASRVQLLSSDQLAAQLPAIRQRAARYLAADDPRLQALQGLPDLTAPAHQALARVQSKLIQTVTAQAAAQIKQGDPGPPAASNGKVAPAAISPEHAAAENSPAPAAASGITTDTEAATVTGSRPEPAADTKPETSFDTGSAAGVGGGSGGNGGPPSDDDLVSLTGTLGRDQQIAAMALGEASRAEDQQQAQVRRFRGVLLGIFAGLLVVVGLLILLGSVHASYFPLCLKGTTTACPTGGSNPNSWDLGFIMAIGGVGAILSVATSLSSLKPTGVRYSLSVAQGLIKIPFGAITAMLGIIILSTQANIGVLATHAGLISTAVVFGYSQQLFTQFIDKRANGLLNQAGGNQ